MKTLFKTGCIFIQLFVFLFSVQAADFTGKKTLTKSYSSGSNTSLAVDNKYGFIHIQEWDKDQVSFEVTITTKAKSQNEANSLLETVRVNFTQAGSAVSASTSYDDLKNCNNCSRSVDYQIMVPKGSNYALKNKYGNISLNDARGSVTVDLAYGDLKGGVLNGDKNSIQVKYGNIDIEKLIGKTNGIKTSYGDHVRINTSNSLNIQIDYSQLVVVDANTLTIQSSYNDKVNVQNVKELVFQSKYEDYKIGTADKITGEASHTDMDINRLNQSLMLSKLSYGELDINLVAPGFENITATATYSDVEIRLDPKVSCQFDLSGKYSDLSVESAKKNISVKNDNVLKGSVGTANSGGLIKINTQYGDVEIKQ